MTQEDSNLIDMHLQDVFKFEKLDRFAVTYKKEYKSKTVYAKARIDYRSSLLATIQLKDLVCDAEIEHIYIECKCKNIDRQDGCDECLDCGTRNY